MKNSVLIVAILALVVGGTAFSGQEGTYTASSSCSGALPVEGSCSGTQAAPKLFKAPLRSRWATLRTNRLLNKASRSSCSGS